MGGKDPILVANENYGKGLSGSGNKPKSISQKSRGWYPSLSQLDKQVCLGMTRIRDTMPATNALGLIQEKLKFFGLNLQSHIVSIKRDRASFMMKLGRISGVIHQVCHAHGVHLAVTDMLYKRRVQSEAESEDSSDNESQEEDVES